MAIIIGTPDDDWLFGDNGDDEIYGLDGNDELVGSEGNDLIVGGAGNDSLYGDGFSEPALHPGNDRLEGGEGNDVLYGGGGNNTLLGGDGNDLIISDAGWQSLGVDVVDGGDGYDTWVAAWDVLSSGVTLVMDTTPGATTTASYGTTLTNVEAISILGSLHDDTIAGGIGNDIIAGYDGNDWIHGGVGNDQLRGNNGDDFVDGGAGDDIVADVTGTNTLGGGDGNDRLESGDEDVGVGVDTIDGGAGTDRWVAEFQMATSALTLLMDNSAGATSFASNGTTIRNVESAEIHGSTFGDVIGATHGNDVLDGWGGDDLLYGNLGADALTGDAGQDVLIGGGGADRFIYRAIEESTVGGDHDVILDFSSAQGDQIDLSRIDADTSDGWDQAFNFIGSDDFTGVAGQLHYEIDGFGTRISGDVNGDATADFEILLMGPIATTVDDFVL